MKYTGVLKKMITENASPVQYYLDMEDDVINMNQLLDKNLSITFKTCRCLSCGEEKKIFRQGFCYDCFYKMPQAGDWIMKPELSKAHLGIEDRDLEYEKQVQLQPHVVYLANSTIFVCRSEHQCLAGIERLQPAELRIGCACGEFQGKDGIPEYYSTGWIRQIVFCKMDHPLSYQKPVFWHGNFYRYSTEPTVCVRHRRQ